MAGTAAPPGSAQALDPLPHVRAPHDPVPVAVGVVGAGGRAQSHLATCMSLQTAGYYRFVGVYDADPARAESAAAKFGGAAFPRVDALLDALAREPPAVVVVVTPPDIHHPVVELAASRGIHALVETPLSYSVHGVDLMIRAAQRAGTRLETAENCWRFPEERLKRLAIDQGLIGEVTLIEMFYTSGSYHGTNAARHLVRSPLARVCGDVAEMRTLLRRRDTPAEERAVIWEGAVLRFANGVRGIFQLPVRATLGNRWEVDGTAGSLEGRDLRLGVADDQRVTLERVTERLGDGEALVAVRFGGPRPVEWENPFRRLPIGADTDAVARADEHLSLHRAVVGAGANDYPGEQGRADLAAVLAIYESARREGAPVDPAALDNGLHEAALRQAYEAKHGFPPEEAVSHMDRVVPTNRPMVRGGR